MGEAGKVLSEEEVVAGHWQAQWGSARVRACLGVRRGTDLLAMFVQGALRRWNSAAEKGQAHPGSRGAF